MKHKIKTTVPVEKRNILGFKKTVYEKRIIEVDGKTYRKMKQQEMKDKNRPYSIEEMMLYDDLFED